MEIKSDKRRPPLMAPLFGGGSFGRRGLTLTCVCVRGRACEREPSICKYMQ